MEWWITRNGITQGPASWAGNPLYAGPYQTKAAAQADFKAGIRPGSGNPPSSRPKLTRNSTFGQVKAWIDSKAPGEGQKFIDWVDAQNGPLAPVSLNATHYGSTGFGIPANSAVDWLGQWLVLADLGPGIAKILAGGIQAGAQDIPKELAAATSWQTGFLGFLSKLGQPVFWLRAAEVIGGLVLLILGLGKMTGAGTTVLQVAKSAKGAVL